MQKTSNIKNNYNSKFKLQPPSHAKAHRENSKTDIIFRNIYVDNNKIAYVYDLYNKNGKYKNSKKEKNVCLEKCIFKHERHTFKGDFYRHFLYMQ
jgi:hypothetical protein